MKTLITVVLLGAAMGCSDRAKLAEDQRQFKATVQGVTDGLQWRVDDETAAQVFDDGTTAGLNRYLTFRKCHGEPPAGDANRKACAALQKRVADAEAKAEKQHAKENGSVN